MQHQNNFHKIAIRCDVELLGVAEPYSPWPQCGAPFPAQLVLKVVGCGDKRRNHALCGDIPLQSVPGDSHRTPAQLSKQWADPSHTSVLPLGKFQYSKPKHGQHRQYQATYYHCASVCKTMTNFTSYIICLLWHSAFKNTLWRGMGIGWGRWKLRPFSKRCLEN